MLAWPYNAAALMPEYGMDPGWSASLEMAAHQRLPFGTHVVFAYGPLGFLAVWPVYFTATAILGFFFFLALYTTVFTSLVWSLRKIVPISIAIILAFVAGTISINIVAFIYSGEPEKAYPLALIGCVYALTHPNDTRRLRRLWIGFGFGLGIITLVKVSVGVGIAVALVVTIICLPVGKKLAAEFVVPSAILTFAIGWFATGNGFGNLLAFRARFSLDDRRICSRRVDRRPEPLVHLLVGCSDRRNRGGARRCSKLALEPSRRKSASVSSRF